MNQGKKQLTLLAELNDYLGDWEDFFIAMLGKERLIVYCSLKPVERGFLEDEYLGFAAGEYWYCVCGVNKRHMKDARLIQPRIINLGESQRIS